MIEVWRGTLPLARSSLLRCADSVEEGRSTAPVCTAAARSAPAGVRRRRGRERGQAEPVIAVGANGVGGAAVEQQLVVRPTVDAAAVRHAEVVARGEQAAARGAREAAEVVDALTGPHHQLVGLDARAAVSAHLDGETPAAAAATRQRARPTRGRRAGAGSGGRWRETLYAALYCTSRL